MNQRLDQSSKEYIPPGKVGENKQRASQADNMQRMRSIGTPLNGRSASILPFRAHRALKKRRKIVYKAKGVGEYNFVFFSYHRLNSGSFLHIYESFQFSIFRDS